MLLRAALAGVVAMSAFLLPAGAESAGAAAGPPPRPPKPAAPPNLPVHQLAYAPGPLDNPLKGFAPFLDGMDDPTSGYPHSLDWAYLALSEVVTDPNDCRELDWSLLESYLDRAAAAGHQVAMRFYVTYPDGSGTHPENGLPACLTDKVARRPDTFWGVEHPDYDDPDLLAVLRNFTSKLGKRYDGDPRIGFLTMGLVGLWGEWHTWPYDTDTSDGYPNYMPTVANQKRVIGWLDDAFDTTMLEARYAELADSAVMQADMGFHDDSWCFIEGGKGVTLPESLGGWDWSQMAGFLRANAENRWVTNSMGGEVRPEIQRHAFDNYPTGNGVDVDDVRACIELEHSTWKINHAGILNYDPADPKVAAAVRAMGYELHVSAARFNPTVSRDLEIGVTIENRGVAPFYYRWPVELGLRDANGRVTKTWRTGWDVRRVQPLRIRAYPDWQTSQPYLDFGWPQHYQASVNVKHVRSGSYDLVMRVVNPLLTGKKLRFANATQGADGWLDLGTVRVRR